MDTFGNQTIDCRLFRGTFRKQMETAMPEKSHSILKVRTDTKDLIDKHAQERGMSKLEFTDRAVRWFISSGNQSSNPRRKKARAA